MDLLKEMFPQFEEAAIQAVLDEVGGDIEEASAVLLSPGFQPSKSPKPAEATLAPPSKPVVEEKKRFEDDWVVCFVFERLFPPLSSLALILPSSTLSCRCQYTQTLCASFCY